MTTTRTPTAGLSILRFFSFCLAILLVPACVGQGVSTSATPTASTLPDAPVVAYVPTTPASRNAAANASASAQVYVFAAREQRVHAYFYDLIGPAAFVAPAIAAGFDQEHPLKFPYPGDGYEAPGFHPAHGTVPEWSEGLEGYSKRYADRFGQGLLNTTSRYALGEILREDVTYHRCTCTGNLPRVVHALEQTLIAHTRSGRGVPSIPAIVSPFAASEIAVVAWYPSRFNSSDALRTSVSLYAGALPRSLLAEFKKSK